MIRSIRVTLTLWYVGILAVILCLFTGVLYSRVAANLAREIDEVAASQADAVAESIFLFWEAEHLKRLPKEEKQLGKVAGLIQKEIEQGRFSQTIETWASQIDNPEATRPIRVMDLKGTSLYSSPAFSLLGLPLTENALAKSEQGLTVYETFGLRGERVRMVTRPVIEAGDTLYVVQTTVSLHQADVSLKQLRLWLVSLVPVTLFVSSAVGWFLATLALRPVGRMIVQAREIGAGDLQKRIDLPGTRDELERLAVTFNEMLTGLERSFRRLRQFTAAASHELRTPLTVMKGELEVTLRKPRSSEEYRRALKTHLETLNELTEIVEQLLTLGRSEAGERAVEWRPVELAGLVRETAESFRRIAESQGIQVEISSSEPVWVRGEKRLLERLTCNLLENALKHTPPQGRVTLQVFRRDAEVGFGVKDTGPGISPEELPGIFDKFFQRTAGEGKRGSAGLGLGLCRWIAEAHRGRIEVSSLPGQGATFTVWLPLQIKNL